MPVFPTGLILTGHQSLNPSFLSNLVLPVKPHQPFVPVFVFFSQRSSVLTKPVQVWASPFFLPAQKNTNALQHGQRSSGVSMCACDLAAGRFIFDWCHAHSKVMENTHEHTHKWPFLQCCQQQVTSVKGPQQLKIPVSHNTGNAFIRAPPPQAPGGRVEGKHGRTNGRHRANFCSNYNHFSTATFQPWTISHFLSGVVSDTVLWLGKCVQPVNTVIYPVHFVSCFIAEHECSGRRCSIDQFSVWNSDGPWPNTELWLWRTAPLQASLPGVSECALVLKIHGHTLAHPTCLTRMLLRLHHWFKPDDWEVIKIQNRSLPTQSPTHSALPQWCL